MAKDLPKPAGYRLLLKPREVSNKTAGGIILTDESVDAAKFSCVVSEVIDMGDDCYHDKDTKWCKKGDWVIFARYAGSRIQIDGGEVRLLNDDEVLATIENPEDIYHQY